MYEVDPKYTRSSLLMTPDTLLMNAFNNINLAAALLVTSTDVAKRLNIPESKWIYPIGGAGTQDSVNCKF